MPGCIMVLFVMPMVRGFMVLSVWALRCIPKWRRCVPGVSPLRFRGVHLIPNGLQKFFQFSSVKPYSATLRAGIQFDPRPLDNQHANVAVGTQ